MTVDAALHVLVSLGVAVGLALGLTLAALLMMRRK